jgi:uncharacterized protein YecT (DUF1311 family)
MNCLRTIIASLAALVCAAASAEATPTDAGNKISVCLEGANGDAGRERACIDTVAGPCMQKPDGQSTPGMVDCLMTETKAWDDILNTEYQRLLPLLKGEAAGDVKKAQRLWVEARDADCRVPYYFYDGGTIVKVLGAECERNHTAERAILIKNWREMAQGEDQ